MQNTAMCIGLIAFVVACNGNKTSGYPVPEDPNKGGWGAGTGTGDSTGTGTGAATGGGTGTGYTGDPCVTPPPIGPHTTMTHVPGTEEFAFDDQGMLLNIDDGIGLLYESDAFGFSASLAPFSSDEVGAIRFVHTGEYMVVADESNGALMQLYRNGATAVLLGAVDEPNSIAIHREGFIYTTAKDQIWLVDEAGVNPPILQFELPGMDLDGLVLSNDYEWLYFNHDEDGFIGKAHVNKDGSLDPPVWIADISVGGGELDGMAIDVCDNLYVVRTDGKLYRVNTVTEQYAEIASFNSGWDLWATSASFGSGLGGWRNDHLYVMNRYGELWEVPIGIQGKPDAHLVPQSP